MGEGVGLPSSWEMPASESHHPRRAGTSLSPAEPPATPSPVTTHRGANKTAAEFQEFMASGDRAFPLTVRAVLQQPGISKAGILH